MSTNLFATVKLQAQEGKNELEPVKASIPRPTNGAHVYTLHDRAVAKLPISIGGPKTPIKIQNSIELYSEY